MNIDKKIDEHECPDLIYWCVASMDMELSIEEREHTCYLCWKNWCKKNGIEITYD